jgi:hypothetical protein
MDRTITFDHEVGIATIKVSDVNADLVLPPEFESKQPAIA